MVLCFVALFVFAVLGIFSAKYRALAREAFGCVTRTLTLRPCESKLDERIKATLIASLLARSPPLARLIHRHFAALSLAFTLLFFVSMAYSAFAVYNYWAYGNCNGPNSSAFCVFDAIAGQHSSALSIVSPGVGPRLGNGSIMLVEFGCFSCPYTKQAQPALRQFLARHPEVSLEFRAFPIPAHNDSFDAARAAFCADEQGRFWPYYDALFADNDHSASNLRAIAGRVGLDSTTFNFCMAANRTAARVKLDETAGRAAGLYGTPTFFLGSVSMVGPKSVDEFEAALRGQAPAAKPEETSACTLPASS